MVTLSTNSNSYLRVALSMLLMFTAVLAQEPSTDPANEVARLFLAAKTAQEEGKYDDAILLIARWWH